MAEPVKCACGREPTLVEHRIYEPLLFQICCHGCGAKGRAEGTIVGAIKAWNAVMEPKR